MMSVGDKQLKYERALEYEIFVKGEYDFAKEKIQNAKCIFDVGGHIGLFSQWCKLINLKMEIHFFEPIAELFNRAKVRFGNDKGLILNNCGFSSKLGNGMILFNEEKTMQSSKFSSFLNSKGVKRDVSFITLKNYLIKNNIDKIDVMKMDIEGMEFEVLSSRGEFEREKIENLIVEIHLLSEEMKLEWEQIFSKIKNIFVNVEIVKSGYLDEIFLIRCFK